MGIKDHIIKVAGKAGDAIAKTSVLSPEQLEHVQTRRGEYLREKPDLQDPAAKELTRKLLASCGVEIHNAYLPQIDEIYAPIDATIEFGEPFDSEHNIRFMNLTKWVTDPEENGLEKLVNVYGALADDSCNIALVFNRTCEKTDVYLAVANTNNDDNNVIAENLKNRLTEALQGNFPGSEASSTASGIIPCLDNQTPYSVATVSSIPAEKSEKFGNQTIEKLLDGTVPTKRSEEYTLILLATPVHNIDTRKLRLAELHSTLAPYMGWQTNFTLNESDSTMSMATVGVNIGVSAGTQQGQNASVAGTSSVADSSSVSATDSTGSSTTDSTGSSVSDSTETSNSIAGSASAGIGPITGSVSTSHGTTTAHSTGSSISHSVANNVSHSVANSLGRAVTNGVTKTAGAFSAVNLGGNFGASFARASSVTATVGKGEGITQTFSNYTIKHALETLEKQMKRLDLASALGMWDFAAYVLSADPNIANNVAHSYLALTQGEKSYLSQRAVNLWRGDLGEASEDAREICTYLRALRHPQFGLDPNVLESFPEFSDYPTVVTATTALSGKELSYALNFPKRSITGLPVIECARFGRNVSTFDTISADTRGLELGHIFHMHREEPSRVLLSTDSLASHVFVTGSTGAGKTNTVRRIIDQAIKNDVTFLIVEPAKGEYKNAYGGRDDVSVYGTNPALTPLLQLNPFSFPENVHVLEHMDRLVEVFNVCWPMYAAMPAVLKSAMEHAYTDCGWDLIASTNPYGNGLYPNLADVARNVWEILDTSDYDAENKGAYKGSLLTRLESLTTGINGMILGDSEIPAKVLFEHNAVIDLSRVGSTETKSLLMGLLILKLQEYRMSASQGMNLPLRHLTVLEEAHNLLKRTSTDQPTEGGNLLGKSVEMLSNAIAEMRTYGEGFVIADQAPGLLDLSVIRNTNTKIIMRLPDLSDRELVGRAANLNDTQITELARLPRGVAAVYQNDWIEPVLCKIAKADDEVPLEFSPEEKPATEWNYTAALEIASALSTGNSPSHSSLSDIKAALDALDLSAFMRVSIMRMLENPPKEPKMTRVAPLVSALFPDVKRVVTEAYEKGIKGKGLTETTEASLASCIGAEVDAQVERFIVQGVITQRLFNELHQETAFRDWYNGLR